MPRLLWCCREDDPACRPAALQPLDCDGSRLIAWPCARRLLWPDRERRRDRSRAARLLRSGRHSSPKVTFVSHSRYYLGRGGSPSPDVPPLAPVTTRPSAVTSVSIGERTAGVFSETHEKPSDNAALYGCDPDLGGLRWRAKRHASAVRCVSYSHPFIQPERYAGQYAAVRRIGQRIF